MAVFNGVFVMISVPFFLLFNEWVPEGFIKLQVCLIINRFIATVETVFSYLLNSNQSNQTFTPHLFCYSFVFSIKLI